MSVQSSTSKTYTLTRGKLATFDMKHMIELQKITGEARLKKWDSKINAVKIKGDFNGGSSVTFRVNADIRLTSLGFWGPLSGSDVNYDVTVNVVQGCSPNQLPNSYKTEVQILRFTTTVNASPNAVFYVPFPNDELIIAKKYYWTKISFMLKGPETRVCSGIKYAEKCPESRVEFDFNSSSHQMPEIKFCLL